jgi:hypothetical protein
MTAVAFAIGRVLGTAVEPVVVKVILDLVGFSPRTHTSGG